ncbi:GAF domain-containing protein [Halorussus marinus]|uniref:GAF domain-containing protein n=1 Tax=Halorussus marinus TaxID=2505976 RepID=UPI00109216DC|nr:GAF domain-containing protein [Halorussus marinus]
MPELTAICVDPDESERAATVERLGAAIDDAALVAAGSIEAAVAACRNHAPDCVVTEYDLPDGTGLELVSRIREIAPDTGCVLHTAVDRETVVANAPDDVVVEYVDKSAETASVRLARLVDATARFRTQTAYPLPKDESARLAALDSYDLDADDLRADVERLTSLAARHYGVSTASINIIDESQQDFLVCHGADWTPTDREDAICTYTIVDDGSVTVIENVAEDPRFADNETLESMGIRSYMGADLTTPSGETIGTFCVYHDEPRSFDDDDRAYLRTLSTVAMRLLELHDDAAGGDTR